MKSKKILLLSVLSALSVGSVVGISLASSKDGLKARASGTDVWSHYSGVSSGIGKKGIKEYWVSCDNHTHQFTAPEAITINDKGAPSQEFIDSLSSDDDRLIKADARLFDFEDGIVPSEFVNGTKVSGFEINSTEGTHGSKCLQANITGSDYFFGLSKTYMDKVFANSAIQSIAFDAKATAETENFRYATNGTSNIYEEYQYNNSKNVVKDGISTNYKTFYFTRDMYNQWKDGDFMIKGGDLTNGAKVYIDNVRTSYKKNSTNATAIDFESGCAYRQWDGSKEDWSNNWTVRGTTGQIAFVSGAGAASVGYDYAHSTDGNRSLCITKQNGYAAIYTSSNFYNSLDETGMTFDIYTDGFDLRLDANSNNSFYNDGIQTLNNWGNPKDGWVTYNIPKNKIGSDGRFLIVQGSPAGKIYIDNIRPAKSFASFELDVNTTNQGTVTNQSLQYMYCTGYKLDADTKGVACRDSYKDYIVLMNGADWMTSCITDEKASVGDYSLKMTKQGSSSYTALFISPLLLKHAKAFGYEFKMDLYSELTFAGTTSFATQANANCVNKWGTITLSGDDLLDPAKPANGVNGRVFGANTTGGAKSIYIDNIRVVPASK